MQTSILVIIVVVAVLIEVLLANWVARDARAHGLNPVRWMSVVLLTGGLGLFVYLWARAKTSA